MAWMSTEVFVAKHDFTATREDEVSLRAGDVVEVAGQTSLKWYSTIAVLSGTLVPAGTFLKNNDKICPAD